MKKLRLVPVKNYDMLHKLLYADTRIKRYSNCNGFDVFKLDEANITIYMKSSKSAWCVLMPQETRNAHSIHS